MKHRFFLLAGWSLLWFSSPALASNNCLPHWPHSKEVNAGKTSVFRVFRGCKGSLLFYPRNTTGTIPVATRKQRIAEQSRLQRWSQRKYFVKLKKQLPQLRSLGVSLCCSSSKRTHLCLSLHGPRKKVSAARLQKALAAVYPGVRCLPVVVRSLHRPKRTYKPRCTPSDFRCLPIPYDKRMTMRYKAKKQRRPVFFPRTSGGKCKHDGECKIAGCGNHCVRYDTPSFAAICPYYQSLKTAWCGCVQQKCRWFSQ